MNNRDHQVERVVDQTQAVEKIEVPVRLAPLLHELANSMTIGLRKIAILILFVDDILMGQNQRDAQDRLVYSFAVYTSVIGQGTLSEAVLVNDR